MAISIPNLTSQLEKKHDAVTLSNIRAAYALAQSSYLTPETTSADAKYTAGSDVTATVEVKNGEAKVQSGTIDNFSQLPFADKVATLNVEGNMGGNNRKI